MSRFGRRAVAIPPPISATLLIARAFTLGKSETQPQKTRPAVLVIPITASNTTALSYVGRNGIGIIED